MGEFTMKAARQNVNLTQSEMAVKLNMSLNAYRHCELCPKHMRMEKMILFCEITKRKLSDIKY